MVKTRSHPLILLEVYQTPISTHAFPRQSALQLNDPESEWGLIQSQHHLLSNHKIAHLIWLNEGLTIPFDRSEFTAKRLSKACQLLNAEGWLLYCQWLNEEMVKALTTFQPEDLEGYQLQAILEDFGHEIRSLFLAERQEQIKAIYTDEPSFEAEKKLVSIRQNLKTSLQTALLLLTEIVQGIKNIEEMHPELVPLKHKAFALQLLLSPEVDIGEELSFPQKIMLLQLLDQFLGVYSILIGHRLTCAFVYSLRVAVSETTQLTIPQILDWNKQPSETLQKHFFENLINVSHEAPKEGETRINPNLIQLLPPAFSDPTKSQLTEEAAKLLFFQKNL